MYINSNLIAFLLQKVCINYIYFVYCSMNNGTIYIPAMHSQKSKVCKVTKIGKLHKANRVIKIQQKRENLEAQFMAIAAKSNRADKQRAARRAKR